MKRTFRFSVLILIICLTGCTSAEKETPTESEIVMDSVSSILPETSLDSISEDLPFNHQAVVRFICRDIGQGMDNPLYEVSLLVGTSYYTLDTIHTCQPIPIGDYDEFEVPQQALSAAGGWWKNAGDYFYAMEENGEIVVMHAWQTEEQSIQGYFYKEQRRILLPVPVPLEDM